MGYKHLRRYVINNDTAGTIHVTAIVRYLTKEGRCILQLEGMSLYWRYLHGIKIIQNKRSDRRSVSREISPSSIQLQIRRQSWESDNNTSTESNRQIAETSNSRRSSRKSIPADLSNFMLKSCTIPIENVISTSHWLNSSFKFIMNSDKCFQRAVQFVRTMLCKFTYFDYLKLYKSTTPIFCALNGKIFDYYYDYNESLKICVELLEYQFHGDGSISQLMQIKEFIQTLYDILEKKKAKTNSILIISAPTAGKNFFLDAILHFFINIGHIGNFNKYCNFPLNDAVERRVNVWNEPNFTDNHIDELKMLCAGDVLSAKVKFKNDYKIYKTPLILMANSDPFRKYFLEFKERLIKYTWLSAPYLKKYDKKPHPYVWPLLLQKYEINI